MNTDLDFSSSNKTLHCTFIGLFVVETFSVSLFMTKRERELSKEKVKHATEKNEENESGDYQYVVR
jgi:hypothetical protein